MQQKASLFAWFKNTIEKRFSAAFPETPYEILLELAAPEYILAWAKDLQDSSFSLKLSKGHDIPDLESRVKTLKRNSGQYYTPDVFAEQILNKIEPDLKGKMLDPACGDGSFLLAVANRLKSNNDKTKFLNRLFGYDIDNQALLVCLGRLLSSFPKAGWPVLRCENFLTTSIKTKFSLILGNPPYKVNLSQQLKNYLLKTYKTTEGEKDLYTFFIEKSIEMLKKQGNLLFLTSHTYLVNHQCKAIRKHVFANRVKNIFLLPGRFFPKAPGVLPVVTHLVKQPAQKAGIVKIHSDYKSDGVWKNCHRAELAELVEGKGLRQSIVPAALKEIFAFWEQKFPTLGSLCKVGVGIQEAQKRKGTVSKFVYDQKLADNFRPVLKGKEITPFKINWNGKYIDYGKHLAYAGKPEIFAGNKLLYQNIRNEKLKIRIVAALDEKGFYPKNSLSFILSENKRISLLYLEAVLNSLLVNAWFSGNYHSFHITVSQIRSIPLPIPDEKTKMQIETSAKRLKKIDMSDDKYKKEFNRLNQLVCFVYTGNESQQLLKDCDIFLEQAAGL
ncbi:MAG: TaqI-like C-terminal specificity domain-containing protein [Candidatus Rifleibacteriota bacterium]